MTGQNFAQAFFVRDKPRVHQYEAGCAWYVSASLLATKPGITSTAQYLSDCTVCKIATIGAGDQQLFDAYFSPLGIQVVLIEGFSELHAALAAGTVDAFVYEESAPLPSYAVDIFTVPEVGVINVGPFFRR
eukprot:TRINITY_DN8209_c0_g1_i2.p1 TRINITY_DN8209_c0_g1~~TRINITY_DN8209_c0_g1_i2.p1  ORF type:complete len:131 (-),score=34.04 TRINITY_DN8209_c0_g1_i2:43-435(-)